MYSTIVNIIIIIHCLTSDSVVVNILPYKRIEYITLGPILNIFIIIYRLIKERHYVLTKGVAVSDIINTFLYEVYRLYRLPNLIKAYSLTLIYGDESTNALASLLRYLYSSTIKLLDNRKILILV